MKLVVVLWCLYRLTVICPTVSEEESEITILASQESEISHYSSSNEEINDTVELLHNCSEDYVLTEPIVQPVRQRVETIECQISNQDIGHYNNETHE